MTNNKVGLASLVLALAALGIGCAQKSGQARFVAYEGQARALVAQMTLDEKIGQMMQPDQKSLKSPDDVTKYSMGSLLSGGGSGPAKKEDYTFAGWTKMVEDYQAKSMQTRLKIPLLYGVDAVHGHNNIPGATIFPHNIGLGCARDPDLVRNIERATAEEVRATGINWVFAPCVTVPQDIRWGRTYEGYSSDTAIVSELGPAAVQGFQGDKLDGQLSVLACAKHFIGDGGTSFGSAKGRGALLDQGDTRVDEETLRRVHLPGYRATVDAGVATIMPSYSSWNGTKCSASHYLLTDVLKKELGFEGFLISDYNAVDQIDPDYRKSLATAINAGIDMVMMTEKYPQFAKELKFLVEDGTVPQARIDDAVKRILRVKLAAGLMEKSWSPKTDEALAKSFGSPEHRALARQAVRESLVLLKNEGKVLPLSRNARRIHLAGRGADNLGMQCGGWTVDWQGSMKHEIKGGTSLLTAMKQAAGKQCDITYSADGTGAAGADLVVVVVGETPYAEMQGDQSSLNLATVDHKAFENAKAAGIPVVVVVYSGRPIMLGDVLEKADAVVAAWLPGSEGAGMTDVLFGDVKPKGRLSFPWPKAVGPKADVLFPLGYGLTY